MQPQPQPVPADELKSFTGPYDPAGNGVCACHGTPVNGYGRCEPLNMAFATAILAAHTKEADA